MRLGEFRTKTKELKNGLKIKLSVYDSIMHDENGYVELEMDIVTENDIFFRVVKDES